MAKAKVTHTELYQQIQAAANVIRTYTKAKPDVGIILGTGLGALSEQIKNRVVIPYTELPHFPQTTLDAHAGEFIIGQIGGRAVAALSGRFHYYEGYSMQEITLPVRVLKALGANVMITSGASGGMNPQHATGDVVIIEDHINLMGDNPLIGPNDEAVGPRYPDMCEPYDKRLIRLAIDAGIRLGLRCHTGVYVAVAGPNLETRAEYRMLRIMGADVVGMSVVPEVLVAVHCGMKVMGMAIVTDMCLPDALKPTNIAEIIRVANHAEKKMTAIVTTMIGEI